MSSLKAWYFLLRPCIQTAYAVGAYLGVGSREPQLIFLRFVVGLSLTPGHVALLPVVPRDVHGLAPAGKSVAWPLKTQCHLIFMPHHTVSILQHRQQERPFALIASQVSSLLIMNTQHGGGASSVSQSPF